jgi:hypothetical protein
MDGFKYAPCATRYHDGCCKVGAPFTTRLKKDEGLILPAGVAEMKNFICEACTVRSVCHRELEDTKEDETLLRLERMRIIDLASHWSNGTYKQYKTKYKVIRKFELDYRVSILTPRDMAQPPNDAAIPLMWAQEKYALSIPKWRRNRNSPIENIKFGTVRGIRSAASQYWSWDQLLNDPEKMMMDDKGRPIKVDGCSPTDELGYVFFTDGMRRRLGDHAVPSVALLDQHVRWIDNHMEAIYQGATTSTKKQEVCRVALVNLFGWLGWLRGGELFGLRHCDVDTIQPADFATQDLPANVGTLTLRLSEQTKSNRYSTADVVLSFFTSSGFAPGIWLQRLREELGLLTPELCEDPVFCHEAGQAWDSRSYRNTYLYNFLEQQRMAGDAFLAKFDGAPGNSIAERFWSFHCYRRGGRTHVSKKRPGCARKATKAEVSEHARWRVSRGSMDMPTAYLEWTLADRVTMTLCCM